MKNQRPRSRRSEEERNTESDRFEFARRHIIQGKRLEESLNIAKNHLALWREQNLGDANRPKTSEQREELKALEAKIVEIEAKILIHNNDGRLL